MRPFLLMTVTALALLAAAPSVGVAQAPAEADLVVLETSTPYPPPPNTFLIGDSRMLRFEVTNEGDATTNAKLRVSHPLSNASFNDPLSFGIGGAYETGTCGPHPDTDVPGTLGWTCRVQLDPGETLWLQMGVKMNAPGTAAVSAIATGSAPEANPSDNSLDWTANVECSINGTDGDDVLYGTAEVDSICGGDGNDRFISVTSHLQEDKLFGQDGDDVFEADEDGDAMAAGGPGFDTVTFAKMQRPVVVCRQNPYYTAADGSLGRLVNIEQIIGSPFGDTLTGSRGTDRLFGGPGKDVIIGLGGRDVLYGGKGNDRFITNDKRRDVIQGGAGSDKARADGNDVVISSQRTTAKLFNPCNG